MMSFEDRPWQRTYARQRSLHRFHYQVVWSISLIVIVCFCLVKVQYFIQGCWANPDGANSDDRAYSDDFLTISIGRISSTPCILIIEFYRRKKPFLISSSTISPFLIFSKLIRAKLRQSKLSCSQCHVIKYFAIMCISCFVPALKE